MGRTRVSQAPERTGSHLARQVHLPLYQHARFAGGGAVVVPEIVEWAAPETSRSDAEVQVQTSVSLTNVLRGTLSRRASK